VQESTLSTANMPEDQLLELYAMATQAQPFLKFVFQLHQGRTLARFQQIEPEHTKEIMWLKALDTAMLQISNDFSGIIGHAERLIAERARKNSPEQREKDRLNKQGFGL